MSLLKESFSGNPISRRKAIQAIGLGVTGLTGAAILGCDEKQINITPTTSTQISPDTKSQIFPTPNTTKTPEAPIKKEGVLPMGDWQLEIAEWNEQESQPTDPRKPQNKILKEGWKFSSFKGRLRNVSGGLADSENRMQFYFTNSNGDKYPAFTPTTFGSFRVPNSYSVFPNFPPGFSRKVALGGWVPANQSSYSLKFEPANDIEKLKPSFSKIEKDLSKEVSKGETIKNPPIISPEAKISPLNTPLVIPNWGEISFSNEIIPKEGSIDSDTKKPHIDQYVQLKVKNSSGQDISTGDVVLLAMLRNGDHLSAGRQGIIVPPGLEKKAEIVLAGDPDNLNNLDKVIGGAVLAVIVKNDWIAWQIPTK